MNWNIIVLSFGLLLITGCVQESPLDVNVEVVGDASTFHTTFEKGNNSLSVLIEQRASKILLFPLDYATLRGNEVSIICYDTDFMLEQFRVNVSDVWYTSDYIEIQSDARTLLKFPELRSTSLFNPETINHTRPIIFTCIIHSGIFVPYVEYVDGVLIENTTVYCGDYRPINIDHLIINCEAEEPCQYQFGTNREQQNYIEHPELTIMKDCYRDHTKKYYR